MSPGRAALPTSPRGPSWPRPSVRRPADDGDDDDGDGDGDDDDGGDSDDDAAHPTTRRPDVPGEAHAPGTVGAAAVIRLATFLQLATFSQRSSNVQLSSNRHLRRPTDAQPMFSAPTRILVSTFGADVPAPMQPSPVLHRC